MCIRLQWPGFLLAILISGAGCATTGPHRLAWDPLPFPRNSNWNGPPGSPAKIEAGDLVLQGQMVRTHETYSAPLVIECVVELEKREAADGYFGLEIVPNGSPRDVTPTKFRSFRMIYRNPGAYSGKDVLAVFGRDDSSGDRTLWGEEPFPVAAPTPYALRLEIVGGHLRGEINGKRYNFQGVQIPYKQFYIQLESWQPSNRWHVKEFSLH